MDQAGASRPGSLPQGPKRRSATRAEGLAGGRVADSRAGNDGEQSSQLGTSAQPHQCREFILASNAKAQARLLARTSKIVSGFADPMARPVVSEAWVRLAAATSFEGG